MQSSQTLSYFRKGKKKKKWTPFATIGAYIFLNCVLVLQFIFQFFLQAVQSVPYHIIYLKDIVALGLFPKYRRQYLVNISVNWIIKLNKCKWKSSCFLGHHIKTLEVVLSSFNETKQTYYLIYSNLHLCLYMNIFIKKNNLCIV